VAEAERIRKRDEIAAMEAEKKNRGRRGGLKTKHQQSTTQKMIKLLTSQTA